MLFVTHINLKDLFVLIATYFIDQEQSFSAVEQLPSDNQTRTFHSNGALRGSDQTAG